MTGNTESHLDTPMSAQASFGPGRLVRQARETVKLSLDDLSAQIKLARNTLDAIERDDFAQLNEPVYVRGYYRKLAKVLPVGEAELLAAYARVAGHKAPPHPSKLILAGDSELGGGQRMSSKLVLMIVVLGLLIGGLLFWARSGSEQASPLAQPEPQSSITAPVAEVPAAMEQPASAPVTTELTTAEIEASAPVTVAPVEAATPSPTPLATTGQSGPLHLQFDSSSWTEVKDATGKVLISGLVEAGSKQVLDGTPPFVVFLGNAPAVKISYQGKAVDTSSFQRGDNTARITIP